MQEVIEILLTKLFYMLLDLYENLMSYPNDLLSHSQQQSLPDAQSDDQLSLVDSIHLFTLDLLNLIGANFKHLGQKHLLDIMLKKLTTTISLSDIANREAATNNGQPNNASQPPNSVRRNTNILLTFIRNKISLITLCTQFIEPNDLNLFNMYYTSILTAIKSILYNNNTQVDASGLNINPIDILNQKFTVVLQLLTKFSFLSLERLVAASQISPSRCEQICAEIIDTNLNFLTDLNFSFDLINFQTNNNLKLIIDQCINNYVSILNISYPSHFLMILKRSFEFNAKEYSLKYGSLNLKRFLVLFQQNEILANTALSPMKIAAENNNPRMLMRSDYESIFDYLIQFFRFEQAKFKSQKNSFYLHWSVFTSELSKLFTSLILTYFERFQLKPLIGAADFDKALEDTVWKLLTDMYMVWIEPASLIEITSQFFINIKDLFDNNEVRLNLDSQAQAHITPQLAIFVMFDSFLNLFDSVSKHIVLQEPTKRNFLLNRFMHFYYETIICSTQLINSSTVNDNTLDCYHKCLIKFSTGWYSNGLYEPDYRSIRKFFFNG